MVPNLYADITARYARLNESLTKGTLKPETAAVLSHRYAYPVVSKDSTGMLGMSTPNSVVADSANDADATMDFIITTTEEDSDGDIVESLGVDWNSRFALNPVIFFGHQSWQIAVGTGRMLDKKLGIYPSKTITTARCRFDKADPDAMFLYGKYQRGFMNATSISFMPWEGYRREKSNLGSLAPVGWHFTRSQGTEWSLVGVGSNPGAVRDSLDREKGDITPKLFKALSPFAAQARGKCFSGYCPCPPCEEDMSKTLNADTLKSGLKSGIPAKKKGKCKCGGKCQTCKGIVPDENTGAQAAGNPEAEHEHEENEANGLREAVAAKLQLLKDAGYDEAQSGAIAHHLAGKGVEGIEGHEEVARALGYKKDDMGGDSGAEGGDAVEMGLKEFVAAVKKSEEGDEPKKKPEEKPAEAASEEEAGEGESEEEEPKFKMDAIEAGMAYNHHKNLHEHLGQSMKSMPSCHIAKGLTRHMKDLEGHMSNLEDMVHHEYPDVKMEDLAKHCKSLVGDGESEEVAEETGSNGKDEATTATDKPEGDKGAGDKTGTELIRDEYSTPKGAKNQKRKSMGDSSCLTEAAKCMKEIAGDPRTCSMHKGALMHHAGNVEAYCSKAESPEEPMADSSQSSEPGMDSMDSETMKSLSTRFDQFADGLFAITGQRF